MKRRIAVAIDQSTSATKAFLFDDHGTILHDESIPHRQITPGPGLVEHDPSEILENSYSAIRSVLSRGGVTLDDVDFIGITNQRETVLTWDRTTSKPLGNALVWQDARGGERCAELKRERGADFFETRTGLVVDAYFSASKLEWLLAQLKGVSEENLAWGTIDSWLIWNFTGGNVHATDVSNASRTLLLDINSCRWNAELLDIFGVPLTSCPDVRHSDAGFGDAQIPGISGRAPILAVMGDSQSALFGQCGFEAGVAKATYGTGTSVAVSVGDRRPVAPAGLVTSVAWGINGVVEYVLEGNIHSTGATVQWLRDNLELVTSAAQLEELASTVADSDGVAIVPAFSGLGAPYWNSEVRAIVTGLSFSTQKAHVCRAALDSIAHQVGDLVGALVEGDVSFREIRADGGASRNRLLMQLQSDILGLPVRVSATDGLSAVGVLLMGGLRAGWWTGYDQVKEIWKQRERFDPSRSEEWRTAERGRWHRAVRQCLSAHE